MPNSTYKNYGVNHIAWVVKDIDSVVSRLDAKGYEKTIVDYDSPYRKRVYYVDSSGFEWEIVEYTTTDKNKKNSYEDV